MQCIESCFLDDENIKSNFKYYSSYNHLENTYNYISNTSYYDSQTHKHLGDFLRYIQSSTGVNLMPFYNCFNYLQLSGFSLSQDGILDGNIDGYKLVAIPIKFYRTYTIAIDSDAEVLIKPIIYSNGLLNDLNVSDKIPGVKNVGVLRFNNPIKYSIKDEMQDFTNINNQLYSMGYEKYLYLAIQLPINNTSSIVVIEGDYTKQPSQIVINVGDGEYDNLFSKLSLLKINDGNIYAFSNRLIEYLLLNVINSYSDSDKAIEWVQCKLGLNKTGIWSNNIKSTAFYNYMNKSKGNYGSLYDITGYIDKDVENFLNKGVKIGEC